MPPKGNQQQLNVGRADMACPASLVLEIGRVRLIPSDQNELVNMESHYIVLCVAMPLGNGGYWRLLGAGGIYSEAQAKVEAARLKQRYGIQLTMEKDLGSMTRMRMERILNPVMRQSDLQ